MINVRKLAVSVRTEAGFEVAIASMIRELRSFDELDQPRHDVKLIQIFMDGSQCFGVFWITLIGSGEPIDGVVLRTPEIDVDGP